MAVEENKMFSEFWKMQSLIHRRADKSTKLSNLIKLLNDITEINSVVLAIHILIPKIILIYHKRKTFLLNAQIKNLRWHWKEIKLTRPPKNHSRYKIMN